LKIDITEGDGYLGIRTIAPSGVRGNRGAKYSIRVPRKITLDRIVTSNAHVRIEGIEASHA
jgi:hypothetical protein